MPSKDDVTLERKGTLIEIRDGGVRVHDIVRITLANVSAKSGPEFQADAVKWLEDVLRANGQQVNGVRASAERVDEAIHPDGWDWYHCQVDNVGGGAMWCTWDQYAV
jgi:hypothetical protein